MEDAPDSPITKLYQIAIDLQIPFIRHYLKLHQDFTNEKDCYTFYESSARHDILQRIQNEAAQDHHCIKGVYLNPSLETPKFYQSYDLNERQRTILTKYRTGSHYLNVQRGRYMSIERTQRICECNQGIQDLQHVIFDCPITNSLRNTNFSFQSINEFFNNVQTAPTYLYMVEDLLKLR